MADDEDSERSRLSLFLERLGLNLSYQRQVSNNQYAAEYISQVRAMFRLIAALIVFQLKSCGGVILTRVVTGIVKNLNSQNYNTHSGSIPSIIMKGNRFCFVRISFWNLIRWYE